MPSVEFLAVFERLRSILATYAPKLVLVHDKPDKYYLDTKHIMKNGQPMFFGAVQLMKGHVGFYLMPIYVHPPLLKEISPELRKRLKGKSCFHFKAVDEALFAELAELTAAGMDHYEAEGLI